MIRDVFNRTRQWLAAILKVESEPTIDVQKIEDTPNSILAFQIPEDMDEDDEEEYIDLIESFAENIQSKILVIPDGINVSEVTE